MAYSLSPRTVEVGTTATLLSGSANIAARIFKNIGSNSVFLGGADVTATGATQGWELEAGAEFPDSISNGAIYGIVAAGTEDVKVWDVNG